jgi:hypothetical protein
MMGLLGKSLTSDSVRQALADLGIRYKSEFATHAALPMPKEGVLLRTAGGILTEIVLFNDSVPYLGQTYKRFAGTVPLGLTWADSLGVEENLLFRQRGSDYRLNVDGVNYASILTQSGTTTYNLQQGYLPAQTYFYYKNRQPKLRLNRNLYYRFEWVPNPHGPYLKLPLICGQSRGGAFSSDVFTNKSDSAWYFSLRGGYRNLSRGKGIRSALDDGAYFGLELLFPVNNKISPPLHQVAGLDYASYTYRDSISTLRTDQNNVPSHTQFSLYYGFAYMPVLRDYPGWRPIAQGVGGVQFDASPVLTLYSNVSPVRARSSSFFYHLGLGMGYQFSSGIQLQLIGHYRTTRFVRYLRYNTEAYDASSQSYYPNLEKFGTKLNMLSIEACIRINLVGY